MFGVSLPLVIDIDIGNQSTISFRWWYRPMDRTEVFFKNPIVLSWSHYMVHFKRIIVQSLFRISQPLLCKLSLHQCLGPCFYELQVCERLLTRLLVRLVKIGFTGRD